LALCGVALAVAVSAGVDPAERPKPTSSAPEDKAAGKVEEAPAGFDNKTNGFITNGVIKSQPGFDADLKAFMEDEPIEKGLGPVYNATSCVACHQNPVPGGSSQIAEIRAGHRQPDPNDPNPRKAKFVEALGGSVIQQRAIDPAIQEHVPPEENVRTLRMSNSILGTGFIEVLSDQQILDVKAEQRRWGMEGFAVVVSAVVGTKKPATCDSKDEFILVERIGRFGWKCQEASLLNFSAGAYVVEMGITSPLQPEEKKTTADGRDITKFDKVKDPEDPKCEKEDKKEGDKKDGDKKDGDKKKDSEEVHTFGTDVEAFTRFMRSTKVPPRDDDPTKAAEVKAGEKLFRNNEKLGCAICHHPDFTTPAAGTPIKTLGGERGSDMDEVPKALGGKVIHPYSDFLLHDIGTGDGIAQTQHANLPPKDYENRKKIPDDIKKKHAIIRVQATPERGPKRVLHIESDLEQRTANKMRTAPLWGLRTRPQLMHDGLSLTVEDAIRRHGGQAEGVRLKYEALSTAQKKQLLAFLNSL
jgi:CxxC motif-containing protein (DUF1111 family)